MGAVLTRVTQKQVRFGSVPWGEYFGSVIFQKKKSNPLPFTKTFGDQKIGE